MPCDNLRLIARESKSKCPKWTELIHVALLANYWQLSDGDLGLVLDLVAYEWRLPGDNRAVS